MTATFLFQNGLVGSCYDSFEVFNHWYYSNPKSLPSPITVQLKLTKVAKSATRKVNFKRKGNLNCATPTVKAIAGGSYYGCLLFYSLKGTIEVKGNYEAKLVKIAPYDK